MPASSMCATHRHDPLKSSDVAATPAQRENAKSLMTDRRIDRKSDRPEFRQIADHLAEDIRSNKFKRGDQLPSESELAELYGVSRLTVRGAMSVLVVEEGLVRKEKGRGSFVREAKPVATFRSSNRFRSAKSPLTVDEGPPASQEVYEIAEVPATNEVANALRLKHGEKVLVRRRSITLQDEDATPMQLADSFVPLDLVTDELRDPKATGVTYPSIESRSGLHIGLLREYLDARMPSFQESRDLALDPGTPVVDISRIAYANTDKESWDERRESADEFAARSRPVEYFKATMVGPLHTFNYDLPR